MVSTVTAGKIAKAAYSGLVAFLGGLSAILTGTISFGSVTAGQWVTITLATVIAAGGTFGLAGWAGPTNAPGVKNPSE